METTIDPRIQAQSSKIVSAAAITERIVFLDNVRAIALLLGILLHAGLAYSPLTVSLWPSADVHTSTIFDKWIWIIHTFRMPLFFLIAGFFACYLVEKRGPGGFIKHRLMRITLPFFIFWPIMLTCMFGIILYAATSLPVDNAIVQLVRETMANAASGVEQKKPPLSTTHLWFLYYLSQFCILAVFVYRFGRKGELVLAFLTKPWVCLLLLPCLSAVTLINTSIPHPAPERVMPEIWAYGFFGMFFAVGWAYFKNRNWLKSLIPYWQFMVVCSLVSGLLLIMNLPEPKMIPRDPDAVKVFFSVTFNAQHFIGVAATAILAWHLSMLMLLGASRFLNSENRIMRFIADGSYWVYIVHLPIVFYLQFILGVMNLSVFTKFGLVVVVTLVCSYLSYLVFVRYTPIGWLLNGRRKKRA